MLDISCSSDLVHEIDQASISPSCLSFSSGEYWKGAVVGIGNAENKWVD